MTCAIPRATPRAVAVLLLAFVLLAGCGQKGPLYLPDADESGEGA